MLSEGGYKHPQVGGKRSGALGKKFLHTFDPDVCFSGTLLPPQDGLGITSTCSVTPYISDYLHFIMTFAFYRAEEGKCSTFFFF